METLKELTRQGAHEEALARLFALLGRADDYSTWLTLMRSRRRIAAAAKTPAAGRSVRVALLGGATTEFLHAPLALSLESIGLVPEIHAAEYNTFAQEMLDADSATSGFRPHVAVLVATAANLPAWPQPGDSAARADELAAQVVEQWIGLCARLHQRVGCEVVINNFHRLPVRANGNLGAKLPWDANNFIRRVNQKLGDAAPAFVHILDVEGLAAGEGVRTWFDARYWHHAKQPVSFESLPTYVRNLTRVIGALYGRTAKCLVLDMDNTLWGGVIGDDGVEGIKLGEGDALGESFKSFQQYVRQLKERGVLLAICSKNEESNALAGLQHPESVLRREDFAAFRANWEPKPDNIVQMARELNLGLDAFVFVDDNPAEREHVRQRLPMVRVIELPEDPALYVHALDDAGPFEVTSISAEDALRTQQYGENAARERLLESTGDYGEYLATLEQRATIAGLDEQSLDRATQLINKSNQFNLTTLRLSRSEVESRMHDPGRIEFTVRLADRFGDNGLISVVGGRLDGEDLEIDLWLMSCRVLKRGVEQLVCNELVRRARERGARRLCGWYLPTAKNALVREHYRNLGFQLEEERPDGASRWALALAAYQPFQVMIAIEESR